MEIQRYLVGTLAGLHTPALLVLLLVANKGAACPEGLVAVLALLVLDLRMNLAVVWEHYQPTSKCGTHGQRTLQVVGSRERVHTFITLVVGRLASADDTGLTTG